MNNLQHLIEMGRLSIEERDRMAWVIACTLEDSEVPFVSVWYRGHTWVASIHPLDQGMFGTKVYRGSAYRVHDKSGNPSWLYVGVSDEYYDSDKALEFLNYLLLDKK